MSLSYKKITLLSLHLILEMKTPSSDTKGIIVIQIIIMKTSKMRYRYMCMTGKL